MHRLDSNQKKREKKQAGKIYFGIIMLLLAQKNTMYHIFGSSSK